MAITLLAPHAETRWMHDAACRGSTQLFFAPDGEPAERRARREAAARSVCAECPVLDPCRAWARRHAEYGVWGGESEEDRAAGGHAAPYPVTRLFGRRRRARLAAGGDAA